MIQRIAVVTGGIGGLGTEICKHLAQSGHTVIAADLGSRTDRIEAFRAEVAEFAAHIHFESLDVGDFASCEALAQRVSAAHGGIDVLVNAAGITRDTTLRKMSPAQ